jgi:hypothetical protein
MITTLGTLHHQLWNMSWQYKGISFKKDCANATDHSTDAVHRWKNPVKKKEEWCSWWCYPLARWTDKEATQDLCSSTSWLWQVDTTLEWDKTWLYGFLWFCSTIHDWKNPMHHLWKKRHIILKFAWSSIHTILIVSTMATIQGTARWRSLPLQS